MPEANREHMRETAEELSALQDLIDRTHARSRPHMRGIKLGSLANSDASAT